MVFKATDTKEIRAFQMSHHTNYHNHIIFGGVKKCKQFKVFFIRCQPPSSPVMIFFTFNFWNKLKRAYTVFSDKKTPAFLARERLMAGDTPPHPPNGFF